MTARKRDYGAAGDSSLVRRVICPKRIGIGLGLGLASKFGICTTPFRTNDPSDKWPVTYKEVDMYTQSCTRPLNGYVHAVMYIDFAQYLVHVGVYIASAHCLFTRSRVLDSKDSMYTISYFITPPKPLFCTRGPA